MRVGEIDESVSCEPITYTVHDVIESKIMDMQSEMQHIRDELSEMTWNECSSSIELPPHSHTAHTGKFTSLNWIDFKDKIPEEHELLIFFGDINQPFFNHISFISKERVDITIGNIEYYMENYLPFVVFPTHWIYVKDLPRP